MTNKVRTGEDNTTTQGGEATGGQEEGVATEEGVVTGISARIAICDPRVRAVKMPILIQIAVEKITVGRLRIG